jgi:nucleotide-binding universal stress UspA family protein
MVMAQGMYRSHMKILIAVDTSDVSHEAAHTARRLFPDAEHVIFSAASFSSYVTAHPVQGPIVANAPGLSAVEAAKEMAEDAVAEAQAVLGDASEIAIEFGDPGRAICQQASAVNADVIVVGRREKHWLSRFFDPSVSEYVIRHAPCSVLVVRERRE